MTITEQDILKVLRECDFEELTDSNFDYKITDWLYESFSIDDLDYHTGATKLVLDFNDLDYVIKIPFAGESLPPEDENGYIDWSSEPVFEEFYVKDYCELEASIYEEILDYNVELMDKKHINLLPLFAKTELLTTIDGYPIYKQKKCIPFNESDKSPSMESVSKASKRCDESPFRIDVDRVWLGAVLEQYGEDTFNALIKLFSDLCISDLHGSNVGYDKEGNPIIFDYSGYDE